MSLRLVGVREAARRFHDDFSAFLGPGDLGGICLGIDDDLLAVDGDIVVPVGDFVRQRAMHGVVLQQVRHGLGVRQVIDGDDFHVRIAHGSPENQTTDTTETIDTDFYCHDEIPP